MEVYIELWGQLEDTNACSWITVGKIDAKSLDIDYLKEEVMKIVRDNELSTNNWPRANMARLRIINGNEKERTDAQGRPTTLLKITLEALW